jgi:predicted  nucleic acid-binding Zn-ribbon protein
MQVNEHPFQAFIDLITLDQEIATIDQSLLKIDHEIAALIKLENQEREFSDAQKKKVQEARKAVDKQELELKTLDAQEKQKKERLDNVTDHKQYQSIKNEIDALKLKQHTNEELLMQAWNVLESTQKEYDALEKDQPQKIASLQQSIEQKNNEITALELQLEQKNELRPEKEKSVPAEWLEKYAVMRARVSDPVVSVQRGACSACYHTLTEQDLMSVRRRKLLQCKGCYRLLYSQELEKESVSDS